MLLLFVVLYLLATVLVGWWASKFVKNTSDFVVAGRQMPLIVVATGLFATWFGSETVMGASAEFLDKGILGVIEEPFGAALCLLLVGMFVARPLYRKNLLTFSDYFLERFSQRSELMSAIMVVPSYFSWIAAQLVALALILQTLIKGALQYDMSLSVGIFICAIIVMFYTYIGGMWAVSVTDFFQTIMIIVGLLIILWSVLGDAGGFQHVIDQQPEGFFNAVPEMTRHGWIEYIAAWITVGFGSIPQQDVFQRVMSAKSERASVWGTYTAAFMYLTIACVPLMIALCGKVLYPELMQGDKQNLLPQMVLQHSNLFLQIMFFGALLSAILSTASGAVLAPATVIGENIIRPYFKHLSDKEILQYMRLAVIGVTVVSATMASISTDIYELVGQSSALSLVCLFIPLMCGLYWKKASDLGALLSMILGFTIWFIALIAGSDELTGVPPIFWGLGASILGMLLGSYFAPRKTVELVN
jgi:solute:Na+ symporter, SSS family